jgi:hypothetical protein
VVEAPGFEKFEEDHLVAEVGSTPTIDVHMLIGQSNESVIVASNAIALDTTEPDLGSTLAPQEVNDLPLEVSGTIRQISSFATLSPGVTAPSTTYGSIQVEGGAPKQINSAGTYFNGIQLNTSSAVNSNPPYDMVDEFRVLRSTFSAKYGLVQGAVSYNMRSGTNNLHGDAFLIDRNSIFDSYGFDPAKNSSGVPIKPADQEVNYGGTVGGPVILPRYNGRNRTFFLASFDIYSKDSASVATPATVPTPAETTGDFSGFPVKIYDPTTGAQFPGNKIPAARIDPLAMSLAQLIPAPNQPGQENNMSSVVASYPLVTHAWGLTLNHAVNASQNIAFTWWRNFSTLEMDMYAAIVPPTNPLTGQEDGNDLSNIWLFNYEKIMTPNLVMTAGAAVEQKTQTYQNAYRHENFGAVQNGTTLPVIKFLDGDYYPTPFGLNDNQKVQNTVDNIGYNFVNNWLWTKGRHTFNFGGELHHYYQNSQENYSSGEFDFSKVQTARANKDGSFSGGSSFASFLLGLAASASRNAPTTEAFNTVDVSTYVQDDIKLNRNLIVHLGMRWDVMRPYLQAQNNNVFLNETTPNPLASGLPGAATEYGYCAACARFKRLAVHWDDFGPHVGFSYSLNTKMVLQGGYFITYLGYDSAYAQSEQVAGLDVPVNLSQPLAGEYQVNSTGGTAPGYGNWSTGHNAPMVLPSPQPFSPSLGVGSTISYLDPSNGKPPVYQAWSLNLQRELPWNMFISVAYSGNRVTHLTGYNINPISQPDPSVLQTYGSELNDTFTSCPSTVDGLQCPFQNFVSQFGTSATVFQALQPFSQYSNVNRALDQAGTTFYNALQIQGEKRDPNGLSYLASLTLPVQYDNLATPLNRFNPGPEYVTDIDSYEVKVATTYFLPIGMGQRWLNSGRTGRIFGGWELAGVLSYHNGNPLQITEDGMGLNGVERPNINPGVPLWSGNYVKAKQAFIKGGSAPLVFSTNAFTVTSNQYTLGDSKRAYSEVRGPFHPSENLSAQKIIPIRETMQLALRMDYFNAFNRYQIPAPKTNASDNDFGTVSIGSGGMNRQGQISAIFRF